MTTTLVNNSWVEHACPLHDGLDQDMMQKNRKELQVVKEHHHLKPFIIPINLLFLGLGFYLSVFAQEANLLVERPDHLFPTVVFSSGGFS